MELGMKMRGPIVKAGGVLVGTWPTTLVTSLVGANLLPDMVLENMADAIFFLVELTGIPIETAKIIVKSVWYGGMTIGGLVASVFTKRQAQKIIELWMDKKGKAQAKALKKKRLSKKDLETLTALTKKYAK